MSKVGFVLQSYIVHVHQNFFTLIIRIGQLQFLLKDGSMGLDIFCNFYLMKNHKITQQRLTPEKIDTDLGFLEF